MISTKIIEKREIEREKSSIETKRKREWDDVHISTWNTTNWIYRQFGVFNVCITICIVLSILISFWVKPLWIVNGYLKCRISWKRIGGGGWHSKYMKYRNQHYHKNISLIYSWNLIKVSKIHYNTLSGRVFFYLCFMFTTSKLKIASFRI